MNIPYKGYKGILLKILEAIEYTDDKEDFIEQFVTIIYSQSLIDLIKSLPASGQEKIKQEMNTDQSNLEKIDEVITKYFTEEQRKKSLEDAAKNTMMNYLSAIKDTLSPLQETNLINLLQEFNPAA